MNTIVRKKFTASLVFFLVIILLLSILSAYYLNMLSDKTKAILKENHYSVVYARNMTENLNKIYQEITYCVINDKNADEALINKELKLFEKSLLMEKNNITEIGEDKLATDIETGFNEYRDSVNKNIKLSKPIIFINFLHKKSISLDQQLMLLSKMNENAIEIKTYNAKVSAKNAAFKMSIVGTLCFLIAFIFTFSLGSYYNERFYQLYNGIKEIVSGKYHERLHMSGTDEIYEISLIFDKMAEKLHENDEKMTLTLQTALGKDKGINDINELKSIIIHIKNIEEQLQVILSKSENKK
jgi:hypothetical protein